MKKLTKTEHDIACHHLYLDIALDLLEAELANYGDGLFKVKEQYLDKVSWALHRGQLQMRRLNEQLTENKMKIIHSETTGDTIRFLFLAGKRTTTKTFLKQWIVKEVRRVLRGLADEGLG